MNKILYYILQSFNNLNTGASGKKLTAFVCTAFGIIIPIVTWTYWAFNHNDFSLLIGILGIMTGFVSVLFGINEYGKSKNKDNEPKDEV